jgi:dimethylargininase
LSSPRRQTYLIPRALTPFTKLVQVREPATVDGGDVLVLGKRIFVGLSTRSNQEAIHQLNELLREDGYSVTGVELHGCLHLKSAVTRVDDQTLLINRNWVDTSNFEDFDIIEVDPSEPHAANCLPIGGSIIFPTAFPKTRTRLEERGYRIVAVDVSELAKAEGAVTCCSLIIQ